MLLPLLLILLPAGRHSQQTFTNAPSHLGFPPQSGYQFFFRPADLQRPARNQMDDLSTSTVQPAVTTTHKQFTGIAFPPQVFEILTGNEPTTQNLGGRKNGTTPFVTSPPSINATPVPEIINGAVRPPTRFPPGNKPAFLRPTQRPQRPQEGPATESPDNRVGSPASKPTRPSPATRPPPVRPHVKPSTVVTSGHPDIEQTPPPPPSTSSSVDHAKYAEVIRAVRATQQFLQGALLGGGGGAARPWQDPASTNFLVSPLSVALTMAQLLMAGGPRAKARLRAILRLYTKTDPNEEVRHELMFHKALNELLRGVQQPPPPREPWARASHAYDLALDTAVFVQTGLTLRPAFIHSVESLYRSRVSLLDFRGDPLGSMNSVNQWAEQVSRGKIKNFLSTPRAPGTTALFASSLYFKAAWRNSFAEEYTQPGAFHVTPNESIQVPFMKGEVCDGSKYIDSTKFGVKGIRLAYNDTDDVAMYIFLPRNDNISVHDLAKKLLKSYGNSVNQRSESNFTPVKIYQDPLPPSWEIHKQATMATAASFNTRTQPPSGESGEESWELDEVIAAMKSQPLVLSLPKVVLRGSLVLHQQGAGDTGKDHFSGLLEQQAQSSSAPAETIVHETILEINESGTEAAAITAGSIEYTRENAVFRANRPFLVLLRHEISGLPLFWGAVVRPTALVTSNARHSINPRQV